MNPVLFFYNISLAAYNTALHLAARFNAKAHKLVRGRATTRELIKNEDSNQSYHDCFWFHCASLGEFEQALPVIELCLKKSPHSKIAVSFFSPSGYEFAHQHPLIDLAFYLPQDQPRAMQGLFGFLKPKMLVVVKYELWYHLINTAKNHAVPLVWLSAKLHKKGVMSRYTKSFYLNLIAQFDLIFTQDAQTYAILKPHCPDSQLKKAADTRICRVQSLSQKPFSNKVFEDFCAQYNRLCIVGSSWKPEEQLVLEALEHNAWRNYCVAIVPHQISRCNAILSQFKDYNPLLYSEYERASDQEKQVCRVLVLDRIGMLSKLYRYAHCAWVGGGFSNALHNIYEPAVYGIPVFWGPNTSKFPETSLLINAGIGFSVSNANQFVQILANVNLDQIANNSLSFFNDSCNSINDICDRIMERLSIDQSQSA